MGLVNNMSKNSVILDMATQGYFKPYISSSSVQGPDQCTTWQLEWAVVIVRFNNKTEVQETTLSRTGIHGLFLIIVIIASQ